MGSNKYLTIIMAGDNSRHQTYIDAQRNFDVWVIYYGNDDNIAEVYRNKSDRFWRATGFKIDLKRQILYNKVWLEEQFNYSQYDYIFMPDDDIEFPNGTLDVNELFNICSELKPDSAQPAIINEYYTWDSSRKIEGIFCHQVTWPEMMMPVFRRELFTSAVLPAINLVDFWKTGMGFEAIINKLIEGQIARQPINLVIDAIGAYHTRPVSSNKALHNLGHFEIFMLPQTRWFPEMKTLALFKSKNDYKPVTEMFLEGVEENKKKFLAEYKHIFDNRKKILRWHRRKRRFKEAIQKLLNK